MASIAMTTRSLPITTALAIASRGPDWIGSERYDIAAKAADLPTLFGIFDQPGLKRRSKTAADIFHADQIEKPTQN